MQKKVNPALALITSAALSCLVQPAAAQTNAESGQASDASPTLAEVVVTAQKRSENVQDVPESISIVGQKDIDKHGITSFQDYASLVPNLNQAIGAGGGAGTIVLRGLYTGSLQTTSTTAVYLDEAPFTPDGEFGRGGLSTPDPDLVDVERIEVLKGPQGTLYGASSLGGIIRIVPKDPSLTEGFNGDLTATGDVIEGGKAGGGIKGAVYDALAPGILAVGISGFSRLDPGYIKNVYNGADNLGQVRASGVSGVVILQPFDQLTLKGRILTQSSKTVGQDYQDDVHATGIPLYGEREKYDQLGEFVDTSYKLYELVADYKSPFGDLIGVYSHTENHLSELINASTSYGILLNVYYPVLLGSEPPAGAKTAEYANPKTSANNEEVRFTSKRIGPFEFIVGMFHADEDNVYHAELNGFTAGDAPLPTPFGSMLDEKFLVPYVETSEFGDATYYINENLDFTAGFRHAYDQQSGPAYQTGLLAGYSATHFQSTDDKRLYQAALRWRPSANLSLYMRTATGYRPGGPNHVSGVLGVGAEYQSDTLYDYEVGAKGFLFDRKLSFDGSVYHMNWENVQLNSLVGGFAVIANGGAAHVNGAELQLKYRVLAGLTVSGAFGYNDAKLISVGASTAAVTGAQDGDRLPGSPRTTLSALADYNFPLSGSLMGGVGATVKYQGDFLASYTNSITNPQYEVPGYATLDLRGSVDWRNITFRAIIINVADRNGISGYQTNMLLASQTTVPSQAYLIRPRTFMLSVSASF